MLIINLSNKDFTKILPTIEKSLNKIFKNKIFDKFQLTLLNQEMLISNCLYFKIEFPFHYIEIDGSEQRSYGIIYDDYIGKKRVWVITTTGIEFSEILSQENIVYKDWSIDGKNKRKELIYTKNRFLSTNIENFYHLIVSLIESDLNILSIRFVEGESTLVFPYASDLVFHKSPIFFIQDLITSSNYVRSPDEVRYFLEYRDVSNKALENLKHVSPDFIIKFNSIRDKGNEKTKRVIENKVIGLFKEWYSWTNNKQCLDLQGLKVKRGIILGNSDFSTIGPLQEFYDFILLKLDEIDKLLPLKT